MRTLVIALLALVIGGVVGIMASRMEPTRTFLNEDLLGKGPPLRLKDMPEGLVRFSDEQLAGAEMISCYRDPLLDLPNLSDLSEGSEPVADIDRFWRETRRRDRAATPETEPKLPPPDIEDLPGLIKLEIILSEGGSERSHCGATRIAKNWFITAAHCVTYAQDVFDIIAMPPRVDSLAENLPIQPVTHAVCHGASDYFVASGNLLGDDVALLYLSDVTGFEDVPVADVDLGRDSVLPSDISSLRFAGWSQNSLVTERDPEAGLIIRDGSRFLQGGPLSLGVFGRQVLRADPVNDLGPCQGDSGGPLYADIDGETRLFAVLSRVTPPGRNETDAEGNPTDGCRPHKAAFFIRTSGYSEWMRRVQTTCVQRGRFVC